MREYEFTTKLWEYPGKAAWHFISVPETETAKIKQLFGDQSAGFGSLKVEVTIHDSTWKTSIFPDNKTNTYLLPVKKEIRTQNNLHKGDEVQVQLTILV